MKLRYNTEQFARVQVYHTMNAKAKIKGGKKYPTLCGEVLFYQLQNGVLVTASAENLPQTESGFFCFSSARR